MENMTGSDRLLREVLHDEGYSYEDFQSSLDIQSCAFDYALYHENADLFDRQNLWCVVASELPGVWRVDGKWAVVESLTPHNYRLS